MTTEPKKINLSDYRPPSFLVPKIDLFFELEEHQVQVVNTMSIKANPSAKASESLFLNGEGIEALSIKIDDVPLKLNSYKILPKGIEIPVSQQEFKLEVTTQLKPQDNKSFSGLYKTKKVFCTQMEAEGFRCMTFFPDRPDVLSTYTTTIVGDQTRYPILLSNGNLIDSKSLEGNRHQVVWSDPIPKPCYLFALVAGDLDGVEDSYITKSKNKVKLNVYVDKGKSSRARYAMDSLKQAMKWEEDTYGLEYDLDIYNIVAVDDFNMGAMENKGLNIFNSKYVLADVRSATDQEFNGILRVIGHEYFHNWSGNRVTCRDWFQLSLKEGLTVYRDQEFTCDLSHRDVKRIEDVNLLRTRQFTEDDGPMAHPVRPQSYISIDNFYTMTVYHKGAEVIRMLEKILGLEIFKKGLQIYFNTFDGQAVTTDDFVRSMEQASQRDLTQFKNWYDQAGTPEVSVKCLYDETLKKFTMSLTQKTVDPRTGKLQKPFLMPVSLGLLSSDGNPLEFSLSREGRKQFEHTLELNSTQQEWTFENIDKEPVVSLFRDFSSPVKLNFEMPENHRYLLVTKDTDAFNRWDSMQKIYLDLLQKIYSVEADPARFKLPELFVNAFHSIIEKSLESPALSAKLLTCPSASYFSLFVTQPNPKLIAQSLHLLKQKISDAAHTALLKTYTDLSRKKLLSSQSDVGFRSLKNQILHLLSWSQDSLASSTATAQYENSDNMTDRLAALDKLSHIDDENSQKALTHFYNQWKEDSLVINKWLTLIALSRSPKTFENIKSTMNKPVYDKNNPNNVFALLYSFANSNDLNYHQADGTTYHWMAQQILQIDRNNPQVSSRLASHFLSWDKLSSPFKDQMHEALMTMKSQKLSDNLFEIVDRALENRPQ